MAEIFTGTTGKEASVEAGVHVEVMSNGRNAVLSLLDLTTQIWRFAIIEDAHELSSNTACAALAIRAAATPDLQGAVSEEENEDYYFRCLDLEEELKSTAAGDEDDGLEDDD